MSEASYTGEIVIEPSGMVHGVCLTLECPFVTRHQGTGIKRDVADCRRDLQGHEHSHHKISEMGKWRCKIRLVDKRLNGERTETPGTQPPECQADTH